MRRLIVSIIIAMGCAVYASAQSVAFHAGIQGGLTLDRITLQTALQDFSIKTAPGWHVGATAMLKLPAHFAVQPSVNFEQSRSKHENGSIAKVDAINVPIAVEWGPDLGIIRPFVQVVPYVDFLLGGSISAVKDEAAFDFREVKSFAHFGIGVGGGFEVWRIQISARYNWGLGSMNKPDEILKSVNRSGVTVTLAYLFL